jgi:hypothetical protein
MAATESAARAAKAVHAKGLLTLSGVQGVGVEKDASGGFVVTVHIDAANALRAEIPRELDGVPVRIIQGDRFRKFDTP